MSRNRSARRRTTVLAVASILLLGSLAVAASQAAPATSRVRHGPAPRPPVEHNPRGRFLGVVPTMAGHSNTALTPNGTPPLTYHNGPVQHSSTVFAIFWIPRGTYVPPAYRTAVTQFFGDVGSDAYSTGNVYATDTQYYDLTGPGGAKSWVSYDVRAGGSSTVHDALPANGCSNYRLSDSSITSACLTDAQLRSEIAKAVSSRGWPRGLGSEFFLFTAPGIGSCFDATGGECYGTSTGYCAYHSSIANSPVTLYADQPYAAIDGCRYTTPHGPLPNGDAADAVLNVVSHEANETMTDPLGTAWFDSAGYENGDECAWLSVPTSFNGYGDFDQVIHADDYLLQSEWSNRADACVLKNTYPQPTASFAWSSTPTHGSPVTFTPTVSDADDTVFTYAWDFGDGGTSTAQKPSHTYPAAGTYRVTLVVFDAHGDQVRVRKTITVS